jgi:iron(III) transport system substrate-binding protein
LRQLWGDGPWRNWCRALAANKPFLVDGNSVVVQMVARGEAWVGFTDSDDIAGAQREGLPVAPLPVTDQTLFVFNTVGVIRDCPHPDAAERLYEFLSNPKVSEKLVELRALEAAALPPAQAASGIKVDWDQLLQDLDTVTAETKDIFLR